MTFALLALCAIAFSSLMLIPLSSRDPKRLRTARRLGSNTRMPMPRQTRYLLVSGMVLPGVALVLAAQWAAFLIWLGAVTGIGWALALSMAPKPVAVEKPRQTP